MEKQFNELRERLLRAGVAPRHVRHYLAELDDHLVDLTAEEVRAGRSRIYYSVTPAGSHRLADLSKTWSNLAAAIQTMLTGGHHGEAIQ